MLAKINNIKLYCKDYKKIENYEEALNSPFLYYCHHRLGLYLPMRVLKNCNKYYNIAPEDLVFVESYDHQFIHKFIKKYQYNNLIMNLVRRYEIDFDNYNLFIKFIREWSKILKNTI